MTNTVRKTIHPHLLMKGPRLALGKAVAAFCKELFGDQNYWGMQSKHYSKGDIQSIRRDVQKYVYPYMQILIYTYAQSILFVVVMFYKVTTNVKLGNTKLFLGEIQGQVLVNFWP